MEPISGTSTRGWCSCADIPEPQRHAPVNLTKDENECAGCGRLCAANPDGTIQPHYKFRNASPFNTLDPCGGPETEGANCD